MSDRKTHWEAVYQDKSPQAVSWYQHKPTLSLRLIAQCGLSKTAAIIDVGGGASTLVDYLLADGYTDLTVLDISTTALSFAQQRLGDRAKRVNWIASDITTFETDARYDVWHDRAVFHFLTDTADRRKYVANLKHALQPGGHVILAAFAIGGPTKCSGLDIVQYDAVKLASELGKEFTLLEQAEELHRTPAGGEQKFGFFCYQYRP